MKVVDGIENLKKGLPYPVLTIGNFDGVHLGHQAIFRMVINCAKRHDGTSVVLTFVPHPLRVIAPERAPKLLTTYKEKIKMIESFGIDVIICTHFTKEFADIPAENFVVDILWKNLGVKELFIGSNYFFGKGRRGSPDMLKSLGTQYGFTVNVIDEVKVNHVTPSSSGIRTLIAKGKVDEAAILLGRLYSVEGIVVEGAKRGKNILHVPTANLLTAHELLPSDGVYAVKVEIDGKIYGGATNIGYNPTFEDKKFSFETHVLDFAGELLGKTLKVFFIKKIRNEMKFSNVDKLAVQIRNDIHDIKNILRDYNKNHIEILNADS
ncbi:MAG: bifunctional riboflavin kinase/FAD synthetase [Nitrospiraceae bacterium]|nr:MAG: bifunctional riboflavin kinase/FAD synthetase [Nitrospiraceae bacterium]